MLKAEAELQTIKDPRARPVVRQAESLADKGMRTVEDLLYYLPFRYEDRRSFARITDLRPGGPARTLSVEITSSKLIRTRKRGFTIFEAVLTDDSGSIKGVWYNQPYLTRVLVAGRHAVFYGRATLDRSRRIVLDNPEYEFLDEEDAEGVHTGRIVPVYRKLGDLASRAIRTQMYRTLSEVDRSSFVPVVPQDVRKRFGLLERFAALQAVHFPDHDTDVEELAERRTVAQRTLAFEEIYLLQLALALRRHGLRQEQRGIQYEITDALRMRLAGMLPFRLTDAQKRVVREIGADLRSPHPMHRLLQGDVGSGKTIVALLTLLVAVENGYQGALMAPTEILAEQHSRNVTRLLEQGDIDCETVLVTGSLRAAPRREALEAVAEGRARIVIGTHALFQKGVDFHRLGLVVVDEQHRFGVLQRAELAGKGARPDVLVMTATPIPRSLSLTLYGDLDMSVIDELPPGRTPVVTAVRGENDRPKMYRFLKQEVARGRQVYLVVPLVEETAKSDLKAATAFTEQLRKRDFPDLRVGMVHGRMKGPEKDEVMQRFAAGKIDLLVATTVIEVGVDVPNATVMVIEHAERFGLSQLHQLRGRVGRGAERSYCVLMVAEGETGATARERLRVMEETTDGFRISEKDLELRGPGMVFGTQQHGLSDLQFLSVVLKSPQLVAAARDEAQARIDRGDVDRVDVRELLSRLGARWIKRLDLPEVG